MTIRSIKQITWHDIRAEVSSMNPGLTEVIDELDISDTKYPLYIVNYNYGDVIVDRGVFQLPNINSHIVPIGHSTVLNKYKDDLGYSKTIPLGILLNNTIEAFMLSNQRVIPSSVVKVGQLISLWRVLEEEPSFHAGRFWNITSGARSICMIPKITDANSHKMLKSKYKIKTSLPQDLTEHWQLFTSLSQSNEFTQDWQSSILFFSKNWLEHKKDAKWARFYLYLHNSVWQSSSYRRNQFIFDFAFSRAQENRNLKPNPYLADTVRHLVAVANGAVPAFAVGMDDSYAPISGLQKAYIEGYGLKKYAPTIVHAKHFSLDNPGASFYSLDLPTTMIFSPKSKKTSSAMSQLHELKYIMETLLSEILKGNLEVEDTPLTEMAKNIGFNYYHCDKDKDAEILPTNEIQKIDDNFIKTLHNNEGEYAFPEFAPFFRGLVAIYKSK